MANRELWAGVAVLLIVSVGSGIVYWDSSVSAEKANAKAVASSNESAPEKFRKGPFCGPNCVYMLLSASGAVCSHQEIATAMNPSARGVSIAAITRVLNSYDYPCIPCHCPNGRLPQGSLPAIAQFGSESNGHFVIVTSISSPSKNGSRTVEVVDGSSGITQRIPEHEFLQEWTGYAVLSENRLPFRLRSHDLVIAIAVGCFAGAVALVAPILQTRRTLLQRPATLYMRTGLLRRAAGACAIVCSVCIIYVFDMTQRPNATSTFAPSYPAVGGSTRGISSQPRFLSQPRTFPLTVTIPIDNQDSARSALTLIKDVPHAGRKYAVSELLHLLRFQARHLPSTEIQEFESFKMLTDGSALEKYYERLHPNLGLLQPVADNRFRVRTRGGRVFLATQPHFGKYFQVMGEIGATLDTKVRVAGADLSLRSGLDQMLREACDGEELEFLAAACAYYVDSPKWKNKWGVEWSFDRMAVDLINQKNGACLGIHRLGTLVLLFRLHEATGDRLISNNTAQRIREVLVQASTQLGSSINSNEMWDQSWNETTRPTVASSLLDEVTATGHHLEWLVLAPDDCRPDVALLVKSQNALITRILTAPPEMFDHHFGPLTHASRAITANIHRPDR